MRALTGVFCCFLAGLAALLASPMPVFAKEPTVTGIRYSVAPPRMRIVVDADGPLSANTFMLASPDKRLVVDLPPVQFDMPATDIGGGQRSVTGQGPVERVRFARFSENASRLVFDLNGPVCLRQAFTMVPAEGAAGHRLVIDMEECGVQAMLTHAGFKSAPVQATSLVERDGRGEIVVVIDPGHGGRDPGAIARTGLKEKDVNLAVAKMLAEQLEKNRRYKVVMTRETDEYLTLHERVNRARNVGADLFISLHADSSKRGHSVRGASVYTLADRARGRAKKEILTEGNFLYDLDLQEQPAEVGNILFDMAQRDTGNRSGVFANIALEEIGRVAPILRNGHRDAGFVVLLAPDVPATLIEMGFLSNSSDAKLLASTSHRRKLARSMARAVDKYFEQEVDDVGFRTARLATRSAG